MQIKRARQFYLCCFLSNFRPTIKRLKQTHQHNVYSVCMDTNMEHTSTSELVLMGVGVGVRVGGGVVPHFQMLSSDVCA